MFKTLAEAITASTIPACIIANAPGNIVDAKVANYQDKDSGLNVVTNSLAHPYSPVSGTTMKAIRSSAAILSKADIEKEMVLVGTCADSECGFEHRTSAHMALAIAEEGKFHCIVCGQTNSAKIKDLDSVKTLAEAEAVEAEEFMNSQDNDEEETAAKDDSSSEDSSSSENNDDDDDYLNDMDDDDDDGDDDEACKADDELAEADEDDLSEIDDALAELDDASEVTTEDDEKPVLAARTEVTSRSLDVDIKATASVDEWKNVTMIPVKTESDSMWVLLAGEYNQVGKLFKSKAHADLQPAFEDRAVFPKAFQAAIESAGMTEEAATRFGFVPYTLSANVDSVVEDRVAERVAKEKATLAEATEVVRSTMEHALTIAALQVIKGFEANNTLRSEVIASMKNSRVAGAEQIVDRAFEKGAPSFIKTIVDRAMELAKESDDSRNAIAKLVEKAAFQYAPVAATASESDGGIGEILANGGSGVIELGQHKTKETREETRASTLEDRINRATASLGQRKII